MPVPRDGALLGWVTDSQVTAMLAVHCRQQETWDDPAPVPEIRVMPMAGTSELMHWPPFAASPLDGGRLWEYVDRDQIVDTCPPRHPERRKRILGAFSGQAERPARGRVRRGHRQPAR